MVPLPAGKPVPGLAAERPLATALLTARRALRQAARRLDEALESAGVESVGRAPVTVARVLGRGRGRGRWSVVDQFKNDGKRYLVARQDPEAAEGSQAFAPLERAVVTALAAGHSTKEIGFVLNLSAATVRVLIMRAIRKTGVRSRQELVRLVADPFAGV